MAITQKEPSTPFLVKSSDIRTMKKDLQRLREADVVRESQKIIQAKPGPAPTTKTPPKAAPVAVAQPQQKPIAAPVAAQPQPKPATPPIAAQVTNPQEQKAMQEAKGYASETERQQIFLLEAEVKNLENQLRTITSQQEPPLALEKNDILIQREKWQKSLQPLLAEEAVIEEKEQLVQTKETGATALAQKQVLEQERWALEEKRQDIEKKRWAVEKELAALEENAKQLEESYASVNAQKQAIAQRIQRTKDQIREISAAAIGREEAKRQSVTEAATNQSRQQVVLQRKEEQHQKIESIKEAKQEYTQHISQATKEKFVAQVKTEEEQRRKFLEDIEHWAANNKE